jgi:hypothetical protein
MPGLRFTTARDLFEAFATARNDIVAEPTDQPSLRFLQSLTEQGMLDKAIAFLAYLLPRREAVWWGCYCMRALLPQRTGKEEALLEAAEAWVKEPEEHRRQAALEMGTRGDRRSAPTWVALAAGWSGGNMVANEHGSAAAPPHLTPRAIRAGVLIAASHTAAPRRAELLKSCLDGGMRLAAGEPLR